MIFYGQEIKWTRRDGTVASVSVDGRLSQPQAQWDAVKMALDRGWTPPKWCRTSSRRWMNSRSYGGAYEKPKRY